MDSTPADARFQREESVRPADRRIECGDLRVVASLDRCHRSRGLTGVARSDTGLRPAFLLRFVHCRVSSTQNHLRGVGGASRQGNADTGAHVREVAASEVNRLVDSLDHAVRDLLCLGRGLDADQYGQELVTAVPSDDVSAAHGVFQDARHMGQHLVPGFMANGVIDLLEIVEVDPQDRRFAQALER